MQLTIHIGSHKSGSTAVQQAAQLLERELSDAGVFYPYGAFKKYPQQHSELMQLLGPESGDELESFLNDIVVSAGEKQHIFLSGEDLCATNDAGISRLYDAVSDRFSKIRIVLVLRNKRDYMISHFNHFLRHTEQPVGIQEFTKQISFNPGKTLDLWQKYFGNENIVIIPYLMTTGPDLLTRFYEGLFGITPSDGVLSHCEAVNTSLDVMTTILVNEALKMQSDFNIGVINQHYRKYFGKNIYHFEYFERDLGDMLSDKYDDHGWPQDGRKPAMAHSAEEANDYLNSLTNFLVSLREHGTIRKSNAPATREFIYDTYRVLLDREPENEAIIQYWLKHTRASMRNQMVNGAEYKRKL